MAATIKVDAKNRQGEQCELLIKMQPGNRQVVVTIAKLKHPVSEHLETVCVDIHDLVPVLGAAKETLETLDRE